MQGEKGRLARGAALATALLCTGANPVHLIATEIGDMALEYRVPAGACPDEAAFRERTADLFNFVDPFVPAGSTATTNIRVDIAHDAAGYHGTVTIYEPASGGTVRTSTEDHKSCDSLVWVLSRRMGMIIERPSFVTAPGKPAPRPAPPVKDPATERRIDALEEDAEDQAATIQALMREIAALKKAQKEAGNVDLTYALSAGALITANLTSNVGPGVWVGGELRAGPLVLGLELRTVLPSAIAATPTLDLDLSQYVVMLTPCGRYSYFFGCAVAGVGANFVYDGNYPGGARMDLRALVQVGGRLGAEVPLGESMFSGRAWGEVLYSTPEAGAIYGVGGVDYPAARPDVSAFFGLGLVVRFGKEER